MQAQKGFTLIELVVVIVILGILAATALPKFIDLTGEAGTAASEGVAGAISSGSAINYAAKKAGKSGAVALSGTNAATCTATNLTSFVNGVTLQNTGTITDNHTFNVSAGTGATAVTCAGNDGGTTTCLITGKNGTAATAFVTCAN